jgi:NAD(P)-dependent dehydrogenase (short-subunit alcohol dehydrogenase family)
MPQQRLAGKRVIVTGAGQGLGREFALHLAALGARVLAADVRADRLRVTREQAAARGIEIQTSVTDVSAPEQTRVLADEANDVLGGLDALVNNAAIVEGLGRRPFDEIDDDEWDRVLQVNVKGVWLCAAVVGLTRVLARELGPSQIRVNALGPGFIPTEGSQTMTSTAQYDVAPTPLGRLGQPADLLGAVAFLVSDESAFITGQTLLVNGGRLNH